ncbi:ABC transporter ATP-binding protein [Paenibacillus albicereus]|uniref:ABC transporter ATP-binding protein n=1 Tax=Paenibacillus albicereus TaxID=2726185 RepID=A0A6H2H0S9_9BACL|nr:ABC transporter ATP-binding protein [Paenibacillus albicereus]QJC53255.1 ABC transporter ATP-binding protein [Paenibacillus albicereus]
MKSIRMYVRLIRRIRPRWRTASVGLLLTLTSLVLNLCQPYLVSRFIDEVLIGRNARLVVPILGASLGLAAVAALGTVIGFTIFRFLEARHTLDMRTTILRHIRRIPLPEIEKHGAGKYMALLGMDTTTTARFINVIMIELISLWLQMLVALAFLFTIDWRLGLMAVAGIPIMMSLPRLYRRPIRAAVGGLRSHNEQIGSSLYESIQGSREIRAYGLEGWEEERNEAMYEGLVKLSVREGLFRQLSGQTGTLAVALATVLLYGFGSGQVLSGAFSVGLLVAAVPYLQSVLNPIQGMNYLIGDLIGSEVAMGRIEAFLSTPAESAAEAGDDVGLEPFPARRPLDLTCKDLVVAYEGTTILRQVSVDVREGQVAAFVGRSGSGKSTFFKAVQGFMPVASGMLRIGERPIRDWPRSALSRSVSFVSQETFLFRGTLFENVALGKRDASEEEVCRALREVGLQAYVDALPAGIHTQLDNQGFQLSGGQRQRMAIARAIIKQPDLLILDEPTSSLDRHTEEQVLSTIQQVMRGKTTLISTHRMETIRAADVIYVMEQGRVVDSGTHDELMDRCALYVELAKREERHERDGRTGGERLEAM